MSLGEAVLVWCVGGMEDKTNYAIHIEDVHSYTCGEE